MTYNNNKKNLTFDTYKLTVLAILTALTFLLQFFVKIPLFGTFTVNVSLTVIVIGAAVFGFEGGAWLGAVSSLAVLCNGDASGFLSISFFSTVLVVMLKGILSGVAAAGCYKLLKKVNLYLSVTVSAIVAPIVNTGIFFLGCILFFMPSIRASAGEQTAIGYILTVLIGLNFVAEFVLNLILVPCIVRILQLVPLTEKKMF